MFGIHGVQQLAIFVFFGGWFLLHYGKSDCYGSHELFNARIIANILVKYSKL